MDVRVKLLGDNVWAAEDDKTGFLSVEVNIFNRLYLKTINILDHGSNYYYKPTIWDMMIIDKTQQIEIWDFLINDQNIIFG